MSPQIYMDDGSVSKALIAPRDLSEWAKSNATLTFTETQNAQFGVGLAMQAMIATERERGMRRQERCIQVGERVDVLAEARLQEGGQGVVLQEPSRPSSELHRIDSESF